MREILFRGKSVDTGDWVEGWYTESAYLYEGEPVITTKDDPTDHVVIRETVRQFTGLLDKNKLKIFEGDIIRIHNDYNGDLNPFNAVVGYINGSFVSWAEHRYGYTPFDAWNIPIVWFEVIGNVYDNPDLIKLEHTTIQRDTEIKASQ